VNLKVRIDKDNSRYSSFIDDNEAADETPKTSILKMNKLNSLKVDKSVNIKGSSKESTRSRTQIASKD
jgi:hypothetical protein